MVFTLGLRHTVACLATSASIGTITRDSNSTAYFGRCRKNLTLHDPSEIPMDRIQLDAAIRSANINGTREDLLSALRVIPDDILFHSLFVLASDTQLNAPALDAATILLELNPTCPLHCVEVVRNIATSDWLVSLAKLPWYVVQQFGLQHVRDAVMQVRNEQLTEIQFKVLSTIDYWAKLAPTAK